VICFRFRAQLNRLISCCSRRKKFLLAHLKMISPWQLLALRGNDAAIVVSVFQVVHPIPSDTFVILWEPTCYPTPNKAWE